MTLRLRRERLRRGWSQTKLAALTDISSPDLSALERGTKPAYPGWRKRLARVFGMKESVLFATVQPDQDKGVAR